jgi:hypothetical protein
MDAAAISQLIASIGFPAAACAVLWQFIKNRLDTSDKQVAASQEASARRELAMGSRINHLEDLVEEKLTTLIEKQDRTIHECTTVLKDNALVLKDSHAIISAWKGK